MWDRIKNAITAILCGHALISISNLVLVPIYLSVWSPLEYGEWLAMFALVGYFSVIDLGMNMAAINRLMSAYAKSNIEEYQRTQHSAFIWYVWVAGCGTILWAIFLYIFPVTSWIGVETVAYWKGKIIIWVGGLLIFWSMPCGLLMNVYRTMGNVAASQWVFNVQQLFRIFVVMVALLVSGEMVIVALSQLIPMPLVTCLVVYDIKRRFPHLMPGFQYSDRRAFIQLVKPSLQFGVFPVSNAIVNHGSVLIISAILGGVAVAVFSTCRTIANFAVQMTRSLNTALWPEITASDARGERHRLRDLHRKLAIGTLTGCAGLVGALWYEGSQIIEVWTRGSIVPDIILLRLMLALMMLQVVWHASLTVVMAANQHGRVASFYLAGGVAGMIIAIPLTSWIGIYGIPVGLIIGEAFICYHFVVKIACHVIGEEYWNYATDVWGKCALLMVVTLSIGWIFHELFSPFMVIRWVGVGVTTLGAAITISWLMWLNREEQGRILSKIGFALQRPS